MFGIFKKNSGYQWFLLAIFIAAVFKIIDWKNIFEDKQCIDETEVGVNHSIKVCMDNVKSPHLYLSVYDQLCDHPECEVISVASDKDGLDISNYSEGKKDTPSQCDKSCGSPDCQESEVSSLENVQPNDPCEKPSLSKNMPEEIIEPKLILDIKMRWLKKSELDDFVESQKTEESLLGPEIENHKTQLQVNTGVNNTSSSGASRSKQDQISHKTKITYEKSETELLSSFLKTIENQGGVPNYQYKKCISESDQNKSESCGDEGNNEEKVGQVDRIDKKQFESVSLQFYVNPDSKEKLFFKKIILSGSRIIDVVLHFSLWIFFIALAVIVLLALFQKIQTYLFDDGSDSKKK